MEYFLEGGVGDGATAWQLRIARPQPGERADAGKAGQAVTPMPAADTVQPRSAPDAVAMVVEYLRAQEHLAEVAVADRRPADLADRVPFLLVERIAVPSRRRTTIGIQAWDRPNLAAARRVIHGALTALYAARKVAMPGGGTIQFVDALGGPTEVPDPGVGEDVFRWVATVDVTIR